jgi:hypothetical protein
MLAFVGVLVLTTDTLMIRLGTDGNADVNKWAVVFYRYFFHGIACMVVNFAWERQGILLELIKTGRIGVLAILMFSSCNISFTMSVQSESPAPNQCGTVFFLASDHFCCHCFACVARQRAETRTKRRFDV